MNQDQELEDAVDFSVGVTRSLVKGQRSRERLFDHAKLNDFHCLASVENQRKLKTEVQGEGREWATLEYTPTWVLAAVCTMIVAISLAMERLLHYVGNILKEKQQKPLFEALLQVKEVGISGYLWSSSCC